MKLIKHILTFTLLLVIMASCKKESHTDVLSVESGPAPQQLSALFEITQDNSGLVTITPNGEGVSYYEVFFGDGTAQAATVAAGKNVQHNYTEGQFNVKIVAHGITGKTTEIAKPLTVTFRMPEQLEVTSNIDAANSYKLNITATALYETSFKVYFGETPNEIPLSFNEGTTVSHVYANVGTYTIRVVALSGGAATAEVTRVITIVDPVLLPLTFESTTINYAFNNFNGGNASVINNPQTGGINSSAKVGKMVKSAGQVWGGSWIGLSNPIDFSVNKVFRMKVFSPRVGAKVLLKVENGSNTAINFEKEVVTTVANAWEDLAFDYSAINTSNSYNHIVLIFELGTMGDGSANFTFLFDDIRLTDAMPAAVLGLPLDFQSATLNYNFTNFDGGNVTIINNPQSSGINTSSKVARMVKSAGQPWGGSWISLASPIDFSTSRIFKMKVFSPRVGAKVLLKVENQTNAGISYEKQVLTTVANAWEELTFDYNAINTANSYQKVVIIFDNGTMGDGSANYTFYFDDIKLN